MPRTRIAVGLHPHNAKHWGPEVERVLRERLHDLRVCALGEIGLDYHYDLSPRDDQKRAFREQLALAKEAGLPVMLHVREAHDDALALMREEGFPEAGTILHCFTSDWETLEPWVQAGCAVTFGGAVTFNNADVIRDAASRVPMGLLLTETDSPYMAPVPLRGEVCEPAMVSFTAERLAEVRGMGPGQSRRAFLQQLSANVTVHLDRMPTEWQRSAPDSLAGDKNVRFIPPAGVRR